MLRLKRQREAVDNGAQDFEQLSDACMPPLAITAERTALGCLKDVSAEYRTNATANVRAMAHEFAVHSVQDHLEVLALARVFRCKRVDKARAKEGVQPPLCDLGLDVGAHHEAEQKLVDGLQVRPGRVSEGLVLALIPRAPAAWELLAVRSQRRPADGRGERPACATGRVQVWVVWTRKGREYEARRNCSRCPAHLKMFAAIIAAASCCTASDANMRCPAGVLT